MSDYKSQLSNSTENSDQNRRQRFLRTADILKKSGLLEITTKTRDLIIKNAKLKEEIAKLQVESEKLFIEILDNPENKQYKELYESLNSVGQVNIDSITSADNTEILELENSERKTSTIRNKKQEIADLKDYRAFYRFPNIALVRAMCRLKLYQTAIALAAVPAVNYFYQIGYLSTEDVTKSSIGCVLALTVLTVVGEFSRKLVGMMYLHEDGKHVRIAHLTFLGHRKDVLVPIEDIVVLSELPDKMSDVYIKLKTYSGSHKFYVTLRFGRILDQKTFENVLGKVPEM